MKRVLASGMIAVRGNTHWRQSTAGQRSAARGPYGAPALWKRSPRSPAMMGNSIAAAARGAAKCGENRPGGRAHSRA